MIKLNSFFLVVILVFGTTLGVHAKDNKEAIQTATLKNGSVLYGFIQQNDGYGNFVFQTDSAIIYLQNVEVDAVDRTVNYDQLTDLWKEWATANDALIGPTDRKTLILSDITVKNVTVKGDNFLDQMKSRRIASVKLQERGVRFKYVEMAPNTYKLSWNDIVSIAVEPRPKTALSGINETYQTKDGVTYEGQYAGETKTTISLYLSTGIMQTMRKSDVVKYMYHPINLSQDIFEQAELLDIVRTENAKPIEGLIIEKNYFTKNDSANYILIREKNGTIQSVKLSDITSASKERNPQYKPEYDMILNIGEVAIDGNIATKVAVTNKKGMNTLEKFVPVVVEKGANNLTTVSVQYNSAHVGKNVEAYRLVPLEIQTKGKNKNYVFTDEALLKTVYRPVRISTSDNGTTKAVYQLNGKGGFVLYDINAKTAFGIMVQDK